MMRNGLAAVAAFLVLSLSACSGPTRTYGPPPKEAIAEPTRILVVHAVTNPGVFAPQVTNTLAACGVSATTLDLRGRPPEAVKAEIAAQTKSFQPDYALEVTLSSRTSDQYGARGNSYDVRLTRLADRKEVWRVSTSVYLRRVGAAGTDKDLADGIVSSMAEAKILQRCPTRVAEEN